MKCPLLQVIFLATEIFFMTTILQLKVAKRRLFEKVSLERCNYLTLTFVSHWQRSPFSCPVIMYWSNGPQRAAVTLGPSIGTVRKGSLEPSNKHSQVIKINLHKKGSCFITVKSKRKTLHCVSCIVSHGTFFSGVGVAYLTLVSAVLLHYKLFY